MQIKTHTSKSCIKLSGKIHVMFYNLSEKKVSDIYLKVLCKERKWRKKCHLNLIITKSSLLFFIRNALSLSMLTAIRSNLLHNVDCDLRVIILSANGGVFSSGHDLKELVRQLVKVVVICL